MIKDGAIVTETPYLGTPSIHADTNRHTCNIERPKRFEFDLILLCLPKSHHAETAIYQLIYQDKCHQ
jgi:hypothetical protein